MRNSELRISGKKSFFTSGGVIINAEFGTGNAELKKRSMNVQNLTKNEENEEKTMILKKVQKST